MAENLLYKVENCNPIAYGRKEASSIRAKQEVPLAVNSPEEVRKLVATLFDVQFHRKLPKCTLKSVFMVTVAL